MIRNIEALRFFAALAVALFHAQNHYKLLDGWLLAPFLAAFDPLGKAGVDVFFVISGFVIWISTERVERRSPPEFLLRRFFRIFVSYWPWLILMAIYQVAVGGKSATSYNWLASVTLFPSGKGGLVLPVSWTLTFELMFFVVFAGLMLLPRKAALAAILLWGRLACCRSAVQRVFFRPSLQSSPLERGWHSVATAWRSCRRGC